MQLITMVDTVAKFQERKECGRVEHIALQSKAAKVCPKSKVS